MAATDVEALLLVIEANTKKLEKDMAKANAVFAKQSADLKRKADALNKSLGIGGAVANGFDALGGKLKMLIGMMATLGGAAGSIAIVREFADIADAANKVGISAEDLQAYQYAAKLAGSGAEEMTAALLKFSKAAGGADEESSQLAKIFAANGVAMKDAEGNLLPLNELLRRYADLVSRAADDQKAAAMAAVGFGKAGAGMVPVLRDMAGGIDGIRDKAQRAGVVLSDDLISKADDFDDKLTAATMRLKSGWAELILETGLLTGAFDALTPAIDGNARSFVNWANELKNNVKSVAAPVLSFIGEMHAAMLGIQQMGLEQAKSLPQDVIDAFPEYKAMGLKTSLDGRDAKADRGRLWSPAGDADKRVASAFGLFEPKKPTSVLPPLSGGSSGGSLDELEREIRAIQEKGAALAVEISMVGKSTEEREKALEMQKLKTAADRAEIDLTPEKLAQLDAIASAYAQQVAQLERVKKGHEDAAKAAEYLGETAVDAMSDIILDGKNAGEVMQQLVKSLAKAALQAALMGPGPLGGLFGGGIFKGLFGSITGASFAGGGVMTATGPLPLRRYANGGVATSPQLALYGEGSRPEAYVPLPDGRRIPVALAMPAMRDLAGRSSGSTQVVFSPVIDARGADAAAVTRVERGLAALAASIPRQVAAVQRMRDVRGVVPH